MANQNKTVSNYYASYYSGTDIRIYFGDMWLDEIVEIQWSVQEQVAPIFGYSSFTWDKVARGNRIVQGSFSINFKEVGYLQTILNSLSSNLKEKKQAFDSSKWEATFQPENNVKYGKYYSRSDSVEYIIDNFAEMSDEYEMAIWGVENNSSTSIDSRKHDTLFYGTSENENNQELRDHGFNILIAYGKQYDPAKGREGYSTAQTIVNVQLTGVSQQVDPSGNPVSEVYTFIAKDISGNVQTLY